MCGIVGCRFPAIVGNVDHINPAGLLAYMDSTLQPRGQTASGIVTARHGDRSNFRENKGPGLVFNVHTPDRVRTIKGHCGIGHNLYQTTGSNLLSNIQPLYNIIGDGSSREQIAVAHNGNLVNRLNGARPSDSDSWCFLQSFGETNRSLPLHIRILKSLQGFVGAFSLVYLYQDRDGNNSLVCARDPWGFRPLYIAELPFKARGESHTGHLVASETCAFDFPGTKNARAVKRGEIIVIDASGVHSFQSKTKGWHDQPRRECCFEPPYFKGVTSRVESKPRMEDPEALEIRESLGRQAAREFLENHPNFRADGVICIPDSSRSQAIGGSQVLGLPLREVVIRNHNTGRTFIELLENIVDKVGKKFRVSVDQVKRMKSIVIFDDSIVRGNTLTGIIGVLRSINPKLKIHLIIPFPEIICPCYFGIAVATLGELAWHKYGEVEGIKKHLSVESLHFISHQGYFQVLKKHTGFGKDKWCHACITGEEPVPITREGYRLEIDKLHKKIGK